MSATQADVNIRSFNQSDKEEVLSIWNKQLGDGQSRPDELDKSVSEKSPYETIVALSPEDQSVVGFVTGSIVQGKERESVAEDLKEVGALPSVDTGNTPSSKALPNKIGHIRSIAVKEEKQGNQIGTLLLNSMLMVFWKEDVLMAYAQSWNHSGNNSRPLFNNNGFTEEGKIEQYWADESIQSGVDCPECGEPPCVCDAVIFTRWKY